MFNFTFKFGFFWTLSISIVTVVIFRSVTIDVMPVMLVIPGLVLFVGLAIGFYLMAKGLFQMYTDGKTEKYGSFVYGKILKIYGTGSVAGEKPELEAQIKAYIPSKGITKNFDEVIGFNEKLYEEGQYVVLKYYGNDVNIHLVVDRSKLPPDILEKIDDDINSENVNDDLKSSKKISEDDPNNNWTYREGPGLSNGISLRKEKNISARKYMDVLGFEDKVVLSEKARKRYESVWNNYYKIIGTVSIVVGIIMIIVFVFFIWIPNIDVSVRNEYGYQLKTVNWHLDLALLPIIFFGIIPIIFGITQFNKKNS